MRFVEAVDYCDVRAEFVSGVAMVSLVSPNVVEVTHYKAVELSDGTIENRVTQRTLWDKGEWMASMAVCAHAQAAMTERVQRPIQHGATAH